VVTITERQAERLSARPTPQGARAPLRIDEKHSTDRRSFGPATQIARARVKGRALRTEPPSFALPSRPGSASPVHPRRARSPGVPARANSAAGTGDGLGDREWSRLK